MIQRVIASLERKLRLRDQDEARKRKDDEEARKLRGAEETRMREAAVEAEAEARKAREADDARKSSLNLPPSSVTLADRYRSHSRAPAPPPSAVIREGYVPLSSLAGHAHQPSPASSSASPISLLKDALTTGLYRWDSDEDEHKALNIPRIPPETRILWVSQNKPEGFGE